MQDYIVKGLKSSHCVNPISNYLSYDGVTQRYKDYVLAFSILREPQIFRETAQDPNWIEAMQQEIYALEENKI